MTPEPFWQSLRLTVLRAIYQPVEPGRLPGYKGSMLRGALGHSLKQLGCLREATCEGCDDPLRCAYGTLYEPVLPGANPEQGSQRVPYIFAPPLSTQREFRLEDELEMRLTLVGSARSALPWVAWAFSRMGARGFGSANMPWQICDISAQTPEGTFQSLFGSVERAPEITAAQITARTPTVDHCRLEFLTPTQLDKNSSVAEFSGDLLIRRLVRRLNALLTDYCGWNDPEYRFAPWIELAGAIRCVEPRLKRNRVERKSSRHAAPHELQGLTGSVRLENIPAPIWPLLQIGEWIHVGKSAAFGLGQYRLVPT